MVDSQDMETATRPRKRMSRYLPEPATEGARAKKEPRKPGRFTNVTGWPSLQAGMEARGLTVETFARQMGMKPRGVEAWIYGSQKPPMHTLVRIAQITGKPIEELIADNPKLKSLTAN